MPKWGIFNASLLLNEHGHPLFYFKIEVIIWQIFSRQSLNKNLLSLLFQRNYLNSTDWAQAMYFWTAVCKVFSAADASINCENELLNGTYLGCKYWQNVWISCWPQFQLLVIVTLAKLKKICFHRILVQTIPSDSVFSDGRCGESCNENLRALEVRNQKRNKTKRMVLFSQTQRGWLSPNHK